MAEETSARNTDDQSIERQRLSDRLDAAGWALFLVWIGLAFLVDVGWGWGLIGIGVIILGETGLRLLLSLPIASFWVVFGSLFLVGGAWELFQIPWPLVPILLILCGLAVAWGALRGMHILRK